MLLGILLIAGALAFGVTPSLRSKSCVMGLVLEAIEVTVIGSGIAGWLEKRRLGPIVLQISLCYSGLAGVCLAFVLAPTSNRPTLPSGRHLFEARLARRAAPPFERFG